MYELILIACPTKDPQRCEQIYRAAAPELGIRRRLRGLEAQDALSRSGARGKLTAMLGARP